MEHLPFARHIAEHMPARAARAFSIGLAGDHQIEPHPQRAQTLAEATPAVHIHPRLPAQPAKRLAAAHGIQPRPQIHLGRQGLEAAAMG